jgi:hypothetical protein
MRISTTLAQASSSLLLLSSLSSFSSLSVARGFFTRRCLRCISAGSVVPYQKRLCCNFDRAHRSRYIDRYYLSSSTHKHKMSDEECAAREATSTDAAVNPFAPTFFDKIVSKEVPATVIFEDDLWYVSELWIS